MQNIKIGLVSTQKLLGLIKSGTSAVKILDCSHTADTKVGDPRLNFHRSHIPGAQYLDIDCLHCPKAPLPMTIPNVDHFTVVMRRLNIKKHDEIVCYDSGVRNVYGYRAAWIFLSMGMTNVSVLDGGFPKWITEDLPTESSPDVGSDEDYSFAADSSVSAFYEEIIQADKPFQLIDVRVKSDYDKGTIPGAINIDYNKLWKPDTKEMKSFEERRALFEEHGIDFNKEIVVHCQRGITVTVVFAGLADLATAGLRSYDGSYAEYVFKQSQ